MYKLHTGLQALADDSTLLYYTLFPRCNDPINVDYKVQIHFQLYVDMFMSPFCGDAIAAWST